MDIRQIIHKGTLLGMAICLLSCSSDLVLESSELSDVPIRLEAGVIESTMTRTAPNTDIQNRAFDGGEPISVYIETDETPAKTIGIAPITYSTSEAVDNVNALTPDYQAYYPSSKSVNIYAVYPNTVAPSSDGTTVFTVGSSQTESTYKQNDLMFASLSSQPKTDRALRLQFSHKMAKIIVNATAEDELVISSVKLKNIKRSVVYTPATGSFGTLSNEGDIAFENGGAVLLPPQSINDAVFIEVETTLGKTASFKTTKTFEEGKEYSISLTVGRINLGLTANIVDWTQDGARQVVEQGSLDDYTITYTTALDFQESFRTAPYEQPDMVIKDKDNNVLVRYADNMTSSEWDYSVVFFGNDQAGTATMVINGNPDKAATEALSWVKTFTIRQLTGSLTYPAYSSAASYGSGYTYEGSKLKVPYINGGTVNWPCTEVCDPGTATYASTNSSVASVASDGTVTILGVGETTIMVSSTGDSNYTAASSSYNLEITKRTSSGLTIVLKESGVEVTDATYTYNGLPCTPSVSVYDGDIDDANLLYPGTDYTVGFSNNLNAGTATVTVTGAGDYDGTATKTFVINPITTTFHESYSDVSMAKDSKLERPATINHLYGTVTYTSSNTSVATVSSSGTVTTGSTTGTATITCSVATPSPENYTAATMTYTVTVEDYDQSYSYTGKSQTYTCKKSGTYLIEVWGAQGGTASPSFTGGGGAYVAGTVHLTKDQVLYVYVGGMGGTSGAVGWNGGGSATSLSTGGGGATDVSICGTANSSTWNETAHLNSRIIVAAGGGGSLYYSTGKLSTSGFATGGRGGAYDGRAGSGVSAPGRGGTLSGAGSPGRGNTSAAGFGYGGNYTGSSYAGAGGGGWYGGGAGGDYGRHGAGGGGSSYLWNSSNASYYSGHGTNNAPTTTGSVVTDATQFYMTERGKSAGTNDGNGKAQITLLSAD